MKSEEEFRETVDLIANAALASGSDRMALLLMIAALSELSRMTVDYDAQQLIAELLHPVRKQALAMFNAECGGWN